MTDIHEQEKPGPQPDALDTVDLPDFLGFTKDSGKVRDVFANGDLLFIVATDRLSAFDRVVGLVPQRGQILTSLSSWWFEQTQDIIPNHMIEVIDSNGMMVKRCERIDLEMVVRGYNTGSTSTSIWRRYSQGGQRTFGSITLPDGMKKNEPLPIPILDPTTKADIGHDEAITREVILSACIVTPKEYDELERISLALFARGQELSSHAGLILVDTKYEFGRDLETGELVLIDEIHTPDSSRFWSQAEYTSRLEAGAEQDSYDKEFIRLWFAAQEYKGEDPVPRIPEAIITELRRRYIFALEQLTGQPFVPVIDDRRTTIAQHVQQWLQEKGTSFT